MDPPLVLWSIDKNAHSYDAFVNTESFVVNVLSMQQSELCIRFAAKGTDKFVGLECRDGIDGAPVLPDYAACFECSTEHRYAGGDHTIIVGRVEKFEDRESDPLIIYRGMFLRNGGPYPEDG